MKKTVFTLAVVLWAATGIWAQGPTFEWAGRIGGAGTDEANYVDVDTAGNIYVVGRFTGTIDCDFDPVSTYNLTANNSKDIFVAKYTPTGEIIWAIKYGGIENDGLGSVDIDDYGNVYVIGSYSTDDIPTFFGETPSTNKSTTWAPPFTIHPFIFKTNPNGDLVWNSTYTTGGYYQGHSSGKSFTKIIATPSGGAYVFVVVVDNEYPPVSYSFVRYVTSGWVDLSGSQSSVPFFESAFFDKDNNTYFISTAGTSTYATKVISKYNASNQLVWAKYFGNNNCNVNYLVGDSAGNIYIAGNFQDSIDFDPYPSSATNLSSTGGKDVYVLKLNSLGNFVWAKSFGGSLDDVPIKIQIDENDDVIVSGSFQSSVDFDPGAATFNLTSDGDEDFFVMKLDSLGNFISVAKIGGLWEDIYTSICFSVSGETYITGAFSNTFDFDPGYGEYNISAMGYSDAFLCKLNQSSVLNVNFYATPVSLYPGDTIHFNDISTGNPTSWHWDFGDGNSDSVQFPTHCYQNAGTYSVSLIVSDGTDSDTLLREDYIEVIYNPYIPQYDYAIGFGGMGKWMVLDQEKSIYVTGYFSGTVDFDPGPGVYTLGSSGYENIFISKIDSSNNLVWAKRIGSSGFNRANSIDIDANGNLYITGYFAGTVDFNPGLGVNNLTATGFRDIFISKFNNTGAFVWAKQISTDWGATSLDIQVDNNGNIYTTGIFNSETDLDPGPGIFNLPFYPSYTYINPSNPQTTSYFFMYSTYLSKLDSTGNFVWAKRLCGSPNNDCFSLDIDNSGNVYVAGEFCSGYGDGLGFTPNYIVPLTKRDAYVARFDPDGNLSWAYHFGDESQTKSNCVKIDNQQNVFIVGSISGTTDINTGTGINNISTNGSSDIFIAKLSGTGNLIWMKNIGAGFEDASYCLDIDVSGDLYLTGYFMGTVDFDPGPDLSYLTSNGNKDMFINKLDPLGNYIWAIKIGGTSNELGYCVKLDDDENIIVLGQNSGNFDFNPGSGLNAINTTGSFIVKLSQKFGANFTAPSTDAYIGDTIQFIDLSTGLPTNWLWDFGDGTTDSNQNPVHIYQDTGSYNVSLIVSNNLFVDTLEIPGYVNVKHLEANFFASETSVLISDTIDFQYIISGFPTTWHWDFGDGTTDTVINPSHIYQNEGVYTVSLIVGDGNYTDTVVMPDYITINPMETNFITSGTECIVGTIVQFTDLTPGYPSTWSWDFGDGTTSILQNPTHIYQDTGTYTVSLVLSFAANNYSLVRPNYITVNYSISSISDPPLFEWVKQYPSVRSEIRSCLQTDKDGNVYITGNFMGTKDFDPDTGVYNLQSNGSYDIYISKLDKMGKMIWAKSIGGSYSDTSIFLALDTVGNIYYSGIFGGNVDFDPGPDVSPLSSAPYSSGNFLSKLDNAGNFVWVKKINGTFSENSQPYALDINGNISISGTYSGPVDFDPGPGVSNMTSMGDNNMFISKLNSDGEFIWAKSIAGTFPGKNSISVLLDPQGNHYIGGYFKDSVDFDPGPGVSVLSANAMQYNGLNMFHLKLSPNGNFNWVKHISGTTSQTNFDIAVDKFGNSYTVGEVRMWEDLTIGPGDTILPAISYLDTYCYVIKYDPFGNFGWVNTFLNDYAFDQFLSIVCDSEDGIYVSGKYYYIPDIDPGPDTYPMTSNLITDYEWYQNHFIAKFTITGDLRWSIISDDNYDSFFSINFDSSMNIYSFSTSSTNTQIDVDPGPDVYTVQANGNYIVKLSQKFMPDFAASANKVIIGDTVRFADQTTGQPMYWQWDFGDGSTSNLKNPVHAYQDSGIYAVSLIASNNGYIDTIIKQDYIIVDHLFAEFSVSDQSIMVGDTVQFLDQSLGTPTNWLWDFGDGFTDTNQNPSHYYLDTGLFTVSQIVSDGVYSDTLTKAGYIYVSPIQAAFATTDTATAVGYPVQFFDQSIGYPVAWHWDFGDGTTDSIQNPVHSYQAQGVYTVSLIATAFSLSDTFTISNYINVMDPSISMEGNIYLDWVGGINVQSYSSGFSTSQGKAVAVDGAGNSYYTGYFDGTYDFDPGNGVFDLESLSNSQDVFILKIGINGEFLWAKSIGSNTDDECYSIAVDTSGNVYTTGNFRNTIDCDPGPGTYDLTSSGNKDAFISKLDSSGNFVWAKSIGGSNSDYGNVIKIDDAGNIFIFGTFGGTVDFDPGPGVFNLSYSSGNVYILKLNPQGEFEWAKNFSHSSLGYGNPVAFDTNGNIYITSSFSGSTDFDPGIGTCILTSNGSSGDVAIVKLNHSGDFIWARKIGGPLSEVSYSLAIDNSGNIITIGKFYGIADFDPGPENYYLTPMGDYDFFVQKIDSTGNFVWAKSVGGTSSDIAHAVAVDSDQNIYLTGYFRGTADFFTGPGAYNLTSSGYEDIFVCKLDAMGNMNWVKQFGGTSVDYCNAIAVDSQHDVYLTGGYRGLVDFDPGIGESWLNTQYTLDMFILKLTPNLNAKFSASDTAIYLGDTIYFTSNSSGEMLNYYWNFGDGATSNSQNPQHKYQGPGYYSVSLMVTDGIDADSVLKENYIHVSHIAANFNASSTSIVLGDTISFFDQSNGYVSSWLWDFGDGTTSVLPDPLHLYQSIGTYTVSLVVADTIYSDTLILPNFITVFPYHANFAFSDSTIFSGESVFFSDLSTGYPTAWHWDFGDGSYSTLQNPFHIYMNVGNYSVSLVTFYGIDSDTIAFSNCVHVIGSPSVVTWSYSNTGQNHIILIPIGSITINGQGIQADDVVGVFYVDDNGLLACGGYKVIEDPGQTTAISAWGDEFSASSQQKNGFSSGEEFHWKIFSSSENHTYNAIATYMPTMPNTGFYAYNGVSGIQSLSAISYVSQSINLNGTWNIFSTYIEPSQNNLDSIFAPVISQIQIMKDENGATFWPAFGLNMIGQLTIGKAYQVKMLSQQNLTITGIQVDPAATNLNLPAGWSLLGYLRTTPGDISILMSSISSEIEIVKDGGGFVFWPGFNVNTIGNMIPGQGYQIKMNTQQIFAYPANSVNVKSATHSSPTTSRQLKNTGSNMTLGLQTIGLEAGHEILVYSQSGLLVGAGIVEDNFTAITLWGDDETTPEIDGLMDGEEFIVKLFDGEEHILEIDSWREGDGHYESNKIAIVGDSPNFQFPVSNFQLFQNIPNPFTHETEISFFLPVDCAVEFDIYDLLGKRINIENTVQTLHATSPPAQPTTYLKGRHTIKFNSKGLPAGTYFYRLKTPDFEQTRKMVLLK